MGTVATLYRWARYCTVIPPTTSIVNGYKVRLQIKRGLLNGIIFYVKVVRLQGHNRFLSVLCTHCSTGLGRYLTRKLNWEPFPVQLSSQGRGGEAWKFCSLHDYDPLVQALMVPPQGPQIVQGEPWNHWEVALCLTS